MKKLYSFFMVMLIFGLGLNAQTFTSGVPLNLVGGASSGIMAPYPNDITVTGVGNIGDVTVTLIGINHTFIADLEVLLVGPTGASCVLFADQLGAADFTNDTITFQIGGAVLAATTGTYDVGPGVSFSGPAPAPAGPYTADLSVFNFTNADGVWSLYVNDDAGGDFGDILDWSVTFSPPPSCIPPTGLSVTSVTASSAVLNWNSPTGAGTIDQVELGAPGFTLGSPLISAATFIDSFVASGLTPQTSYEFYVRTICGPADTSTWTGPFSFATPCLPYIAPYTESFDAGVDACASLSAVTGGPWTWGITAGFWNTACGPAPAEHTGNAGGYIANDMSTPDAGVIYQLNDVDVTALTVPYLDLYHYMCAPPNTQNEVYVEAWDGAAWNFVGLINTGFAAWTNYGFVLTSHVYGGNLVRLRFRIEQGTGTIFNGDIALDDISILEAPSCPNPTNLSASNILDVSADLSWTVGSAETMWEVQYGLAGFVLGTGSSVYPMGTPDTTIFGLTEQTDYDFYVRAICGPADTSAWVGASSFTTPCAPVVGPALESFETVTAGSFGDLGNCWFSSPTVGYRWESENSNGANENSFNTGPFTDHTLAPASGGIYMYTEASSGSQGDSAFLNGPLIDLSAMTFPEVSFWYHMYGAQMGDLLLQVNDGSGWATVASVSGPQQAAGGDDWIEVKANLFDYSGLISFRFVGIRGVGFESDMSIDDVSIQEASTCTFTLDMQDSFGDGWNGAGLTVNVGSTTLGPFSAAGSGSQSTFDAPTGASIQLTYNSGAFENEVTYQLLDPDNNLIFADGPFPATGLVLDTTATCPSCSPPSVLNVVGLFADSVYIEWPPTLFGVDYNWELQPSGVAQGTPGAVASGTALVDTTLGINGLSPSTGYILYVQGNCGTSLSSFTSVGFTTTCVPVFSAPICENFDTWTPGSFGPGIDQCWTSFKTLVPRWEVESTGTQNSFNTGPLADASGSGNYVFLECSGGVLGDADTLTSPAIDLSALALPTFSFEYHMFGLDMGVLDVYIEDVNTGVNTLVSTFQGQQQTGENEPWRKETLYLTGNVGDTVILRFVGTRGANFTSDISLDEICIEEAPSCPDPWLLSLDSIGAEDAYLSWDVPFGTPSYEVEAVEAGQAQGTGIVVATADTFAVVAGLTPDTDYDFYVRAICSATDSSNWVQIGSDRTLHLNEIGVTDISSPMGGCGVMSTPITITVENFGVADLNYVAVVVQLSGDYSGVYTLVIDTLNGLDSTTVTLDSLNTLGGGTANVVAFTNLANDEDVSNDSVLTTLDFGSVPMAPAIANVEACDGDSVVIGFGSLGLMSWFDSDTATSPVFQGDTIGFMAADTTFFVSQQEELNGMATLDLFDSFGDGWNGHTLAVSVNGVPAIGSPFTLGTGSVGQEMFPINNGDSLTLEMFAGGFQGEVSYTVTGPNGVEIFQDGFASIITYGVVFNDVISSVGCPSELTEVSVSVNPTYLDTVVMSACDSMTIAGVTQTTSGFYTDSLSSVSGCDSIVVFDLTINNSYDESVSATICDADSYTLPDGSVVSTAGLYTTILTAANGCDSTIKTQVVVVSTFAVSQNVQLCAGDSLVVGTNSYGATGTYVDTLASVAGCDSVVTSNVVVFTALDVSIGGVTVVCENAAAVDLVLDPLGGTLSGPGVTGSSFDPAAAGLGMSTLVYTFSDANGCDATASLDVEVVVCTGIEDIEGIETISIYPNPYVSTINVMFDDAIAGELNIKLFDITGKTILVETVNTSIGMNNFALEVSPDIAAGVTMLQIERDGAIYSTTLMKK